MKNMTECYLSGGIFFSLLLEAKGRRPTPRELKNGKKCEITNKNMMEGLIQLFMPSWEQPSFGTTFEGDVSDYRACKVSFGANLPFDNEVEINTFDERVKKRYASILTEMNDYISTFLYIKSAEQMRCLINRLLLVIEKDKAISPETMFYISERPITKTELLSLDHYCLSNFLLAIWHFIVFNRPDNELGRNTYTTLYTRAQITNAKWKFDGSFGSSYPRSFTFDVIAKLDSAEDVFVDESRTEESSASGEKKGPAEKTAEPETVEAEVIDDTPYPKKKTATMKGNTYYQYAKTIFNIENIENFNG